MSDMQKDKLIMCWIGMLASSQGFYGRLLNALNEADEDSRERWLSQFRDCRTMTDFVLAVEC